MRNVVWPGAVLGLLVTAWMYVMGLTGWYKHPTMNGLFFLVILIHVGVLIWALRRSARDGAGYAAQVGRGLLISIAGGLLIVVASLLFVTVAFPRYFEELRDLQAAMMRQAGKNEAEVTAALGKTAAMQTPAAQAVAGFIGTVVTGLIASLVIALFARGKKAPGA